MYTEIPDSEDKQTMNKFIATFVQKGDRVLVLDGPNLETSKSIMYKQPSRICVVEHNLTREHLINADALGIVSICKCDVFNYLKMHYGMNYNIIYFDIMSDFFTQSQIEKLGYYLERNQSTRQIFVTLSSRSKHGSLESREKRLRKIMSAYGFAGISHIIGYRRTPTSMPMFLISVVREHVDTEYTPHKIMEYGADHYKIKWFGYKKHTIVRKDMWSSKSLINM